MIIILTHTGTDIQKGVFEKIKVSACVGSGGNKMVRCRPPTFHPPAKKKSKGLFLMTDGPLVRSQQISGEGGESLEGSG